MRRYWLALAGLITVLMSVLVGATPAAAHPEEQVGRPGLPDEETFGTEHFLIHYTRVGRSAVEETDVDGGGLPDYVELVAETVEYVWTVEVEQMGWPHPPFDRGQGGDERIDIYLDNILDDGYAGYVETSGGYITDNPMTPEQERRAAYSYMVLDNDYAEADPDYGETPEGLLQATAAHEFNHVIQAGIDDLDLHAWLYEATATWMEDEVYDDINDGLFYLDSLFKHPDVCLVAEVANGDDLHWYGTWLFIRLLSERYGSDVIRTSWNNMRQLSGFRAMNEALAPFNTDIATEHRDFAVANLLRAYEEGDLYPTVAVEGATGPGTYAPQNGVQSLGADYVRLDASGPVTVTLAADADDLSLLGVGIRGTEADVITAPDNHLTLNADAYDEVYLVIHNAQLIADEDECWYVGYTLRVDPADAASVDPASAVWSAALYVSPEDAPISVVEGNENPLPPGAPFSDDKETATSPADLEIDFPVLLPATLPPGYVFDYAYIMSADEFGDSDVYYVPGGGDTANYDYLDEENDWLSIAESVSPYASLSEWLDDIDYTDTPGQIREISGVEVLVEDLSDPGDPWYSATFILGDLFIVVDGDSDEESVIQLVEGLIAAGGNAGVVDAPPPTEIAADPTSAPVIRPTQPVQGDSSPFGDLTGQETGLLTLLLGTLGVGACVVIACLSVLLPVGVIAVVAAKRRKKRSIYTQEADWQ